MWESSDNIVLTDKNNIALVSLKKGAEYFITKENILFVLYDTFIQKADLNTVIKRLEEIGKI